MHRQYYYTTDRLHDSNAQDVFQGKLSPGWAHGDAENHGGTFQEDLMPGADGPGADSQGDSAAASVLLPSFPAMPISPNTSPTRGSTTCPAPAPGTPPSPHGPAPGQSPALAAGSPTRGGGGTHLSRQTVSHPCLLPRIVLALDPLREADPVWNLCLVRPVLWRWLPLHRLFHCQDNGHGFKVDYETYIVPGHDQVWVVLSFCGTTGFS